MRSENFLGRSRNLFIIGALIVNMILVGELLSHAQTPGLSSKR